MIRGIRLKVPIYTSAILLLMGIALVAQATQPVTRSQMESFVYATIAGAGICFFGSFWVLLTYINARVEAHVSRLEKAVEDVGTMMKDHHLDPLAHPIGTANRLDPINAKLDSIDHRVTTLLAEHRVIRETEDEVCALIRRKANEKRASDPDGFDAVSVRGIG